jgi:spore maturation protein CgeB
MEALGPNLAAIRERSPELAARLERSSPGPGVEAFAAASGAITLRVDGRLEASAIDPEAEARALAGAFLERAGREGVERLVLFGLGVHTLAALERFAGRVLVVEPSLELARALLERVDLSRALARVDLLVPDAPADVLAHPVFRGRERGLLLAHPAARRRAPALHDELAARFHPGGTPRTLSIAVVPPLYGGSLPVAGASARALRQLGHRVREVNLEPFLAAYQEVARATSDPRLRPASETLRAGLVRLVGELLLASFRLDPPDVVFALAQAPLDAETLAGLRAMGIARALWFCEDFRVMTYWRSIARSYDVIFHVQPDEFSAPLREAGGYGVHLPMAFDPALQRPLAPPEVEPRKHALSFVGAGYPNRVKFLPGLLDLGLAVYGTEWPEGPPLLQAMPEPNRRQSSESSNRIFNSTVVNLNLHSSPWCDGVNPAGDFLNPRTFELAGARAFQLVDERRELARHFRAGIELETFRDLGECRRKARHFLAHEDERAAIAANAHARALAGHTYRHRMEQAVDALRAGPVALAPRRASGRSVGAVLAQAHAHPALAEVLARLEPGDELDGAGIARAVARGSGPLSREERLLVFMRECLGEVRYFNEAGTGA